MDDYLSEIRHSVIMKLEAKVAASDYGSYMRRVTLKKVRSFRDRVVSFDFPVTALVGPNGGGKSTILGAAGLAYRKIAPGAFFAKSGKYDASMKDWAIEYELIERRLNSRLPIQRTASFPSQKWNRKAVVRSVLNFGVSRTVPATERRELVKAIGNKFVAASEVELSPPVVDAVEKILGKEMKGCNRLNIDSGGRATLFAAKSATGSEYSEFHFGAGEASVIRIVSAIEDAEVGTLILIEEIENGLHPVATRRMVEYLIDVADRKSCQIIFTTHSNDALAPLPPAAIWAAYNGEVLQGKLDIRSLRTITGQIDARLAIFVEDQFAVQLINTALRYYGDVEMDGIKIHAMGGHSPAIKVNRQHNLDPTSSFPSVCIVDGDQQDKVNPEERVYAFPGDSSPEAHIFDVVLGRIDFLAARLALSIQMPSSAQERVKAVVQARALTNRDRHVIFEQIGEDLDFTAGAIVASAFSALWAQERPEEAQALIDNFKDILPMR
ncbi:ATP-dependent nuclease [Mycobacteroides abscessus]